jgi:hypothetical protein
MKLKILEREKNENGALQLRLFVFVSPSETIHLAR